MDKHKTTLRTLVLKSVEAEIDDLIWPVVEWLNSFEEISTIGCCQGGEGALRPNPFVSFYVTDQKVLLNITTMVHPFVGESRSKGIKLEVHGSTKTNNLWFALDFESPEQLKMFCEHLAVISQESIF